MQIKINYILSTSLAILIFTACSENQYYKNSPHKIINLDGKSKNFKLGVKDGCITAYSIYKKNHKKVNNNIEYNRGW